MSVSLGDPETRAQQTLVSAAQVLVVPSPTVLSSGLRDQHRFETSHQMFCVASNDRSLY